MEIHSYKTDQKLMNIGIDNPCEFGIGIVIKTMMDSKLKNQQ